MAYPVADLLLALESTPIHHWMMQQGHMMFPLEMHQ